MNYMKCPKCNNEFKIQIASNIKSEGCHILTEVTSILTVQCDKCKGVFQLPISGKRFLSVKKE